MDQDIIAYTVKDASNHGGEDKESVKNFPSAKESRPVSLKAHEEHQPSEKDHPGIQEHSQKSKIGPSTRNVQSIDDDPEFWSTYIKEAGEFDKELIEGWNNSLDIILIFAGLFSAINTAFIIESYTRLQPDTGESTLFLLRQILKHRNDDLILSDTDLGLGLFEPSSESVRLNSIFFASLSSSLIAAFGAVTAKQWLNQYTRIGSMVQPHEQGRRRHLKYKGLETWHFWLVMELLPASLQLSLILFLWGMIDFLWPMSWKVATMVLVFSSIGMVAYIASFVIAMLYPNSPFQTSLSNTLQVVLRSSAKPLVPIYSHIRELFESLVQNLGVFGMAIWRFDASDSIWEINIMQSIQSMAIFQAIKSFDLKEFGSTMALVVYIGVLGLRGWLHNRLHPSEDSANEVIYPSAFDAPADWDPKEKASAECVLWLFEQAERPGVTQRALNAMKLLPADRLLELIKTREGLLNRLITLHNSHDRNAMKSIRHMSSSQVFDSHLMGSTLLHIFNGAESEDQIRNRLDYRWLDMDSDLDITSRIILYGLAQQTPSVTYGKDLEQLFSCALSTQVLSAPQDQQLPSTITLVTTSTPFSLLLDIFIYQTRLILFRDDDKGHLVSNLSSLEGNYENILGMMNVVLEDRPSLETISHIAIAVAILQWRRRYYQLLSWTYPTIHDANTIDNILTRAWHAVDKRNACIKNVYLAMILVGSADSVNTIKIYRTFLGIFEELRVIQLDKDQFLPLDGITLAILRIHRQLSHDTATQHHVLRNLKCDFTSEYFSPLHEECGQSIMSLLKSVLYSDVPISPETRMAAQGLLWCFTHCQDFMKSITSPVGLSPHREVIFKFLLVTMKKEVFYYQRYLDQILKLELDNNTSLYAVHREALVHGLTYLDYLQYSKEVHKSIQDIFNTIMSENPSTRWPAYFVTLNIISSGVAEGEAVDFSRIPVQEDDSLITDISKRTIWTGEGLLIIWDEVNKREHEESTYKVFFLEDVVNALLQYHNVLQEKKIASPSELVFRGYLEKAREEVSDSEQRKKIEDIISLLGESRHVGHITAVD